MIKFVCASCSERLSVPDQHGGRKGVCPSCGAINRIPLKGFAETKPDAPVIARPADTMVAPPPPVIEMPREMPRERGALSIPELRARSEPPSPHIMPPMSPQAPVMEEPDIVSPDLPETADEISDVPPPAPPSTRRVNHAPAAKKRAVELPTPPATPHQPAAWEALSDEPLPEAPPDRPEWHLPKPVKITLLIMAVLGIVGGLYCAMYYGIQALMRTLGNG